MANEGNPICVYADETFLTLEDKEHIMVAAIVPSSPEEMTKDLSKKKQEVGLNDSVEIKWNDTDLPADLRNKLTEDIAIILGTGCKGFICLLEGNNKLQAVIMLHTQLSDYCKSENISGFSLYLDQSLPEKLGKFEEYIKVIATEQRCVAVQQVDSKKEPLIQCADAFAGLLSAEIQHEVEAKQKPITFYDEYLQEHINCTLSDYFIHLTRYIIWGRYTSRSIPTKYSLELGFRVDSSISKHAKKIIKNFIATTYIGCSY